MRLDALSPHYPYHTPPSYPKRAANSLFLSAKMARWQRQEPPLTLRVLLDRVVILAGGNLELGAGPLRNLAEHVERPG